MSATAPHVEPGTARRLSLNVRAWGSAKANLAEVAALRRKLPAWAPEGTPGHFFKYSDDQTVVATAAVDAAIQNYGLQLENHRNWAILAAPRFMGRLAAAAVIPSLKDSGWRGISPHVIPQSSLHSISGALSILLSTRGPNVGVGGGPETLDDAIVAAFTLPGQTAGRGIWFVATAWDPEPTADIKGVAQNGPVCHAVALALQTDRAADNCGELRLNPGAQLAGHSTGAEPRISVATIAASLADAAARSRPCELSWQLAFGAVAELGIQPIAAVLQRAA